MCSPKHRRPSRRLAREGAELERQPGHQVAPDSRLLEQGEHRMIGRQVGILGDGLGEGAELRPGHPRPVERGSELLDLPRREPGRKQRREFLARMEPVALQVQVEPELPP